MPLMNAEAANIHH